MERKEKKGERALNGFHHKVKFHFFVTYGQNKETGLQSLILR